MSLHRSTFCLKKESYYIESLSERMPMKHQVILLSLGFKIDHDINSTQTCFKKRVYADKI